MSAKMIDCAGSELDCGRTLARIAHLQARVARRPGRWRRGMARPRVALSSAALWAARRATERAQARACLDAA